MGTRYEESKLPCRKDIMRFGTGNRAHRRRIAVFHSSRNGPAGVLFAASRSSSHVGGDPRSAEGLSLTYLLDVNVLLALAYPEHVHHRRVFEWVNTLYGNKFATCAITELAFVRIASGRVGFTADVDSARKDLARLRRFGHFVFLG